MVDKVTTTSTPAAKKPAAAADATSRVEAALEELREALIDAGQDPGTVDAQMHALQLPEDGVVGNYADLQRMGALVVKGASGGQAVEEAVAAGEAGAVAPEEEKEK